MVTTYRLGADLAPASEADVTDWDAYGRDLASFVGDLHSIVRRLQQIAADAP